MDRFVVAPDYLAGIDQRGVFMRVNDLLRELYPKQWCSPISMKDTSRPFIASWSVGQPREP